ncbi:HigA family addiction module antitoxin [Pontibacter diazotrophicus]|nr:HigA family addiction module antitoxin [Pontibacter diazotrophicus]
MKMNINELTPALAIHPGEHLLDELEARETSQQDFASMIGMKRSQLNEIIKGKRGINTETALYIGKALGMEPEIWLNLQKNYEADLIKLDPKVQERLNSVEEWQQHVVPNVPVRFLKKHAQLSGDPVIDLPWVKMLYGVKSSSGIASVKSKSSYMFRQSTKLKVDQANVAAWVKLVEHKAKGQTVGSFDRNNKEALLQKLKEVFSNNTNCKEEARKVLAEAGIKLVYQEKPEFTPVDGFTFWSVDNPAIGMTLRYNKIDNFAFTLLHELGHVYLHLRDYDEEEIISWESNDEEYRGSGRERDADAFAQDNLIDRGIWDAFVNSQTRFPDEAIRGFAQQVNIHPAIVRGRLCHQFDLYRTKTTIDHKIH